MASFYIDIKGIKEKYLKELDIALKLFNEAIELCDDSNYTSSIKSSLNTQLKKFKKIMSWISSSCEVYDEYSDLESDVISKSEVPTISARQNVVTVDY